MKLFRSVLFVVLFNLATFLQILFWLPVYFFLPREQGWKVQRVWGWISLWMLYLIVGTRFDVRGLENLPGKKGVIVASKHQSTWETFSTLLFLEDPTYIVKKELMWLPFFGWFAWKMDIIGINRGKRSEAMMAMNKQAKRQLDAGRQIVIYPEGTRKLAYAEPNYKYGITHMYTNLDAPVLPVAINSGVFWPRNSFQLHTGTCIMEFLPQIEPGMDGKAFSKQLVQNIENATSNLLAEAMADPEFDGAERFAEIARAS